MDAFTTLLLYGCNHSTSLKRGPIEQGSPVAYLERLGRILGYLLENVKRRLLAGLREMKQKNLVFISTFWHSIKDGNRVSFWGRLCFREDLLESGCHATKNTTVKPKYRRNKKKTSPVQVMILAFGMLMRGVALDV